MSEISSKLAIKTLGKYVKFADNEDTRRLRNLFKGNKNLEFAQGTKKVISGDLSTFLVPLRISRF